MQRSRLEVARAQSSVDGPTAATYQGRRCWHSDEDPNDSCWASSNGETGSGAGVLRIMEILCPKEESARHENSKDYCSNKVGPVGRRRRSALAERRPDQRTLDRVRACKRILRRERPKL
ncbi:hypothetical protein VTN00DRAFT_3017 [Thermoascus crustaceus]|uniref:uncharacterized protein n=1 Tax=Thermoascus crustaceus TaxID=5088 RepID=UPI003743E22F